MAKTIKTKYNGNILEEDILFYYDRLIGKIFRLLPLRETSEQIFIKNFNELMEELLNGEEILLHGGFYIELINKLEGLPQLSHTKFAKSKFQKRIVECIDVVNKLRKEKESEING